MASERFREIWLTALICISTLYMSVRIAASSMAAPSSPTSTRRLGTPPSPRPRPRRSTAARTAASIWAEDTLYCNNINYHIVNIKMVNYVVAPA